MRLLSRPLLALLLLAALATGLSACGSGGGADLLPGTTANQINSNLDQVQQLVAEGECADATEAADQVTAEVDEVGGVDAKLKQLLVEGAERLEEVVLLCEESEEEPLETTEEQEPQEEDEKAGKHEKPEKEKPPKEEEPPAEPEPPGQEEEKGEGPPEEGGGGTPSGGVGPGQEAGGN